MKCKLDKPTACFNCPYPDCIDDGVELQRKEMEIISEYVSDKRTEKRKKIEPWSDNPKTIRRRKYFQEHYRNITENQKEQRLRYQRRYRKEHQKELTEKRKEYHHQYYLKRKETMANA